MSGCEITGTILTSWQTVILNCVALLLVRLHNAPGIVPPLAPSHRSLTAVRPKAQPKIAVAMARHSRLVDVDWQRIRRRRRAQRGRLPRGPPRERDGGVLLCLRLVRLQEEGQRGLRRPPLAAPRTTALVMGRGGAKGGRARPVRRCTAVVHRSTAALTRDTAECIVALCGTSSTRDNHCIFEGREMDTGARRRSDGAGPAPYIDETQGRNHPQPPMDVDRVGPRPVGGASGGTEKVP